MKTIPKLIKIIAIFQIICSVIGLCIMTPFIYSCITNPDISINQPGNLLPTIVLFSFIILSFLAAIGLLKKCGWSYYLAAFVQLPQILFLSLPTFSYFFALGFWANINFFPPVTTAFNFNIGALFNFSALPEPPFGFGINIVAISIFLYLLRFIYVLRQNPVMYR